MHDGMDDLSVWPSSALIIRHGFGNHEKHRYATLNLIFTEQSKELKDGKTTKLFMPTRRQDLETWDNSTRAGFYELLIEQRQPDIIFCNSSGGNVLTEIVRRGKWNGPSFIVSGRKVKDLPSINPQLPVLFVHGLNDNYRLIEDLKSRMGRAELHTFEGGHGAEAFFDMENALQVREITKLVVACLQLRNQPLGPLPEQSQLSPREILLAAISRST
mmetsp:Transcript_20632/g.26304  ORF Transcript_20632/g.26304 Transcript_20632/m.26304 type:complete len:216 (+) Transcript_20632:113-760(+)